jgi:hypothetical protein
MFRNVILGVKALSLLTVTAMALASPLDAQRSGSDIWEANCGRCHIIQQPDRYDAKAWADIGMHMVITARLTSAESRELMSFLRIGARRVASAEEIEPAEAVRLASSNDDHGLPPVLTPEQIDSLARYLRELSRKETASR